MAVTRARAGAKRPAVNASSKKAKVSAPNPGETKNPAVRKDSLKRAASAAKSPVRKQPAAPVAKTARSALGPRPKAATKTSAGATPKAPRKAVHEAPARESTESAPPPPQAVPQVDPLKLRALQDEYLRSASSLWSAMVEGRSAEPILDKRFVAPEWAGQHAYLAQMYLLNSRFMNELADSVQTDPRTKAKIRFAIEQMVDAMAPSNFLATNPEAQKKLLDSGGESLTAGMGNLLADIQKGRISQTDEAAFEVGKNVAVSPGQVVFENDLFQLIQYAPSTKTVFSRPLLIVPPCINKFYILDLQPENSLVAFAVSRGHTVFLVSWRNPGEDLAAKTWDDYIEDGAIRAIRVVQAIGGVPRINVLGFCVGGTIVATALAALAARGEQSAASLTLLTTLLDFKDTGTLEVFIDEAQVQMRERSLGGIRSDGTPGAVPRLMPGRDLASSFSSLRPNDLVWNYVVSNYLKGGRPPAFDLLFWNADSTNLPGPFFTWYLRNTYLENNLKVPGKTKVAGTPVDLGAIDAPVYVYGSKEDHIVPWHAAYASLALLKGASRFVLGASGHIAGVINSPTKNKRNYWTLSTGAAQAPASAQQWMEQSEMMPGSWWPNWADWLDGFGQARIKAPTRAGKGAYRAIEPAPGRYVAVRAD